MKSEQYELVIVGGGVTGTALLYVISKYTNIKRVAIIEKYNDFGKVNSYHKNNSQTLHFGDIETNYTVEKAAKVKVAAEMVVKYLKSEQDGKKIYALSHKMVLAVGDEEVAELEKRYEEFKTLFPRLKKIYRDEIKKIEPHIIKGRDPSEKVMALVTDTGYIVDYGKLSQSFVKNSRKTKKEVDVILKTKVEKIVEKKDYYEIHTDKKTITSKVVVVAAGPHSLIYAQSLGYGKEFGLLPVAGNFYNAPGILKGKTYTMQLKKLPFAAVHGDPEVDNPNKVRFGPTAKVLLMLERHKYASFFDFLKTSAFTINGFLSLAKVLFDKIMIKFLLKQLLYDLPLIGKYFFMKQNVRKIIPSIKLKDLKFAKGYGGVRPQILDTKKRIMNMGEAKIIGRNILFDITPSPGASVCLKNAENNAKKVIEFLGKNYFFDEKFFKKALIK